MPAGSCATMVRTFWPELFEVVGDHDAAARARRVGERTRELSELLAERADDLPALRLHRPVGVALHESCHMLRELRIVDQPAALARRGRRVRGRWPGTGPTGAAGSAARSA